MGMGMGIGCGNNMDMGMTGAGHQSAGGRSLRVFSKLSLSLSLGMT